MTFEKIDKTFRQNLIEENSNRFLTIPLGGMLDDRTLVIDRTTGIEYLSQGGLGWCGATVMLKNSLGQPSINPHYPDFKS